MSPDAIIWRFEQPRYNVDQTSTPLTIATTAETIIFFPCRSTNVGGLSQW